MHYFFSILPFPNLELTHEYFHFLTQISSLKFIHGILLQDNNFDTEFVLIDISYQAPEIILFTLGKEYHSLMDTHKQNLGIEKICHQHGHGSKCVYK